MLQTDIKIEFQKLRLCADDPNRISVATDLGIAVVGDVCFNSHRHGTLGVLLEVPVLWMCGELLEAIQKLRAGLQEITITDFYGEYEVCLTGNLDLRISVATRRPLLSFQTTVEAFAVTMDASLARLIECIETSLPQLVNASVFTEYRNRLEQQAKMAFAF